MEAATERCEAYKPSSTQDKDDKYWQRGAPLPILSKLQLSLQEDSMATWKFYEEHLATVTEKMKMRNLTTRVLPVQDITPSKGQDSFERKQVFAATKAAVSVLFPAAAAQLLFYFCSGPRRGLRAVEARGRRPPEGGTTPHAPGGATPLCTCARGPVAPLFSSPTVCISSLTFASVSACARRRRRTRGSARWRT